MCSYFFRVLGIMVCRLYAYFYVYVGETALTLSDIDIIYYLMHFYSFTFKQLLFFIMLVNYAPATS